MPGSRFGSTPPPRRVALRTPYAPPPSSRGFRITRLLRPRSALLALVLVAGACRDVANPLAPARTPPRAGIAPSACGRMLPGESLERGQTLKSCNGLAMLALQTDQNVVLYDAAGAAWVAPGTYNRGTTVLQMQSDGNLVAYDAAAQPLWSSNTQNNPGAWLAVQDDCNLVVYRGPFPQAGAVLWASNTPCRAAPPASGRMLPGDELSYGLSFTSPGGNATVAIQADQSVVLRSAAGLLWSAPNTQNRGTWHLVMQGDGNLVAYDRSWVALWSTGTGGNPGAWLALQDDCNLVVYRGPYPQTNGALWATMTSCTPAPISPVAGPFSLQCSWAPFPTWDFCQFNSPDHKVGGGVAGADDTYAWDANQANSADTGKPVYATAPGRVVKYGGSVAPGGEFGAVLIEHSAGGRIWWSGYLHMTGIQVVLDQEVSPGTLLGYVSNVSRYSIPPHLHFVMYNGTNTFGGLRSYNGSFAVRN
jgi:hypothetical protein